MSDVITERCPARAALAGNPSDGYGGAVLAVPVRSIHATVTARRSRRFRISQDRCTPFEVADAVELAGHRSDPATPHALVIATMQEVAERFGAVGGIDIEVSTNIPTSTGLAGSSAIVIATLRAILRVHRRELPHADLIASIARSIETDRLDIGAGLQDRVVQAHDAPMMMRFGDGHTRQLDGMEAGTYESVEPRSDPSLFVAAQPAAASPSQVVHNDLGARFRAGEPGLVAAMGRLARHAEAAARALRDGDHRSLAAAMDATYGERAQLMDLDPAHVAMVDAARAAGASANFTGSGGAIVVCAVRADAAASAAEALEALGCSLYPVQL